MNPQSVKSTATAAVQAFDALWVQSDALGHEVDVCAIRVLLGL